MRKIIVMMAVLIALTGVPGAGSALAAPLNTPLQIVPSATAATTDRLNLRSGPSLADSVITVMPAGAPVELSGQEINGFAFVSWDGQKGWAFAEFLDIAPPPASQVTTAITTDRLNLRTGPALSNGVIAVMPAGATVTLTGEEMNGYRSVSWNGQAGWAFAAYLALGTPPPSPSETATTTDRLNLRTGPSLADRVIITMPAGAEVTLTGGGQNGFRPVTWNGYDGWAFGAYLDSGAGPPPAPAPEPDPEPAPATNGETTDSLNLRAGPATSFTVLTVIPRGAKVVLTGESQNGYLSVSYDGRNGWAHEDWLVADGAAPAPVETATTTDALNLREGPATSYRVVTVMPPGAEVTLTGQTSNGFHSVSWNGQVGWAFSAFLSVGAVAPPPPPPPQPAPEPEPILFDVTNTIVGPARGTADEAIAFSRAAGGERMDEVERYIREVYRYAPQLGFDPALIVAQSALETGYWQSDWWTLRLNPAGIGITGDPAQESASPIFPSGTISARAQLAHMHAEVFGSSRPLPAELQGIDPTYQNVFRAGWAGTIRTVDDLAGTWAVDPQYGHKIIRVAREIFE